MCYKCKECEEEFASEKDSLIKLPTAAKDESEKSDSIFEFNTNGNDSLIINFIRIN